MDIGGDNLDKLYALMKEKKELLSELMEVEITILHEKLKNAGDDIDTSDIRDALLSKKSELLQVSNDKDVQETLLESVQMSHATAQCTIKATSEDKTGIINENSKRLFTEFITKQNKLVLKFVEQCDALRALSDQQEEVKNHCFELKNRKRELYEKVQNYKKNIASRDATLENDENMKKLTASMDEKMKLIETLQVIFQKLIHGSQVNWADRAQLQALILELGTKPTFS